MRVLGIESTAHTFGVGVVEENNEVQNEKVSYHNPLGGIHPSRAAQFFMAKAPQSLQKINVENIDLIAFSQGPGLGACLHVGSSLAKTLALYYNKPLIGVNHCIAHIEIGKWSLGCKDPLVVYTSGANTQIIALEGERYRVLGETLDIGIGNALDVFARYAKISGFPAGAEIERLASKG